MLNNNIKAVILFIVTMSYVLLACQKASTAPAIAGAADFTVVNAIPNNSAVNAVVNSSESIMWFLNAQIIYYGGYYQYSPVAGKDTVYAVQYNDTLAINPKAIGEMYYGILPFKKGGIYSLFLCGKDTTSPDYLFSVDSLPYHGINDSTVGIRFVNLSAGSNAISISLEGSLNGAQVSNLGYKNISEFRDYISNSSITYGSYNFVVHDIVTGDSLTSFSLTGFNNDRGVGLSDPNTGSPLVFKNVTIALIGQPGVNASVPQSMILIDNY